MPIRPLVPPSPAGQYDRGNESAFRRMVDDSVRATAEELNRVETLALPSRQINAAQFGLVANLPSAATRNAQALNAAFEEFRSRVSDDGRLSISIPPGTYYIDAPIWAGFDSSVAVNDERDWTWEARGVRLVATDALADRVMVDMTGARRGSVYGLQLFTANSTSANAPDLGILMARSTPQHAGLLYFERCRIQGEFKVAPLLKYSTEIDYFFECNFRNDRTDGASEDTHAVVIVEGTDFYPVSSEFVTLPTGPISNVDHWFVGCTFANGAATEGTYLHVVSADRVHVQDCYFDSLQSTNDFVGVRISEEDSAAGHTFTIKNTHYHQTGWNAHVLIDDDTEHLTYIDSGHGIKNGGATLRLAASVTLNGLWLREDAARSGAGDTIVAPSGAAILNADVTAYEDITIDGDFSGVIRVPSAQTVSLPAGARGRVIRTDDGLEERHNYIPGHGTVVTNASTYTVVPADMDNLVYVGGSAPATVDVGLPSPFTLGVPAGSWFELGVQGGGSTVVTVAASSGNIRLHTGSSTATTSVDLTQGGWARFVAITNSLWGVWGVGVTATP